MFFFFQIQAFGLANSIQIMFAFHCNKIIPKYFTQSEFTVRYIHFVVSRVDSSFKVRLNWLMSAIKFAYKIRISSLIINIIALIFYIQCRRIRKYF